MESANFIIQEDNIIVYQSADTSSAEVTKLNSGDKIMRDEKFKKNKSFWYTVFLPHDKKGYMRAEAKGFKIILMIVKQPKVEVYETPGMSSKIVLTYNEGDKFKVIGRVKEKYDNLGWAKTESLSGVIGYLPINIRAKEDFITTPSQKWPVRIGVFMGLFGVAIEAILYFVTPYVGSHNLVKEDFLFAFCAAGLPAYFLALLFVKLRRFIFK